MTNFWKFKEKYVEILKVKLIKNFNNISFRENFAEKVL